MEFWERSGPHPKGGFTSRGAKRRVRFEKEITHPQHDHMHMHAQQITYAPGGCMKFTHTAGVHAHTCTRSVTTEAKRGHEKRTSGECAAKKKNLTLTPAHTCDRVKIVRAESAPRMRTPAVSSRARARIYMHPLGACIRTEGAVYEPRSEAESAPRKRKKQTEP